jgi:hypothetical protein
MYKTRQAFHKQLRRHFDIVAEKMKALALETRQTKLEERK